jgi:hypothetical protein
MGVKAKLRTMGTWEGPWTRSDSDPLSHDPDLRSTLPIKRDDADEICQDKEESLNIETV